MNRALAIMAVLVSLAAAAAFWLWLNNETVTAPPPSPSVVQPDLKADAEKSPDPVTTKKLSIEPMNFDPRTAASALCFPPELFGGTAYRLYEVLADGKGRPAKISLSQGSPEIKAGLLELEVNSPNTPVVLLLSSYSSNLWQIRATAETKILAVALSGYETQAVMGLKPDIPVVYSSSEFNSHCRFDKSHRNGREAQVKKLLGRLPDQTISLKSGKALIGEPVASGQELISSGDIRPEKYGAFARAEAALTSELDKGKIRPASREDIKQWLEAQSLNGHLEVPTTRYISGAASFPADPQDKTDTYVITSPDFSIPQDLYRTGDQRGKRHFTFIIPPGNPMPEGDLSNVRLLFMENGRCLGDKCGYPSKTLYHVNEVPEKPKGRARLKPAKLAPQCLFQNLQLPANAKIYAGGAYSGWKPPAAEKAAYTRKQSRTGIMTVEVSDPGQTVALILGCSEETIWNIKAGPGTKLAAVLLTGYSRQHIGGLPSGVPVLTGSYDEKKCWSAYFGNDGESLAKINQLSLNVFGRFPDRGFRPDLNGLLRINPSARPLPPAVFLTNSLYYQIRSNPSNYPELLKAVKAGQIRQASENTMNAWVKKYHERLGIENLADEWTRFQYMDYSNMYEILSSDFAVPEELTGGARSAHFFVPEGLDLPEGANNNCTFYLLENGGCRGSAPGCLFIP